MKKTCTRSVAVRLLSVAVIAGLTTLGTSANATTTLDKDYKKAEYGTGDAVVNYGWQVDTTTNGEKLIKDAGSDIVLKYDSTLPELIPTNNNQDLSDTTIVGNYIDKTVTYLNNQSNGRIGTLDLNIIGSNLVGQRLINNNSNAIIDNLKGNYAGNTITCSGSCYGGELYNVGTVNSIESNFLGNALISQTYQSMGGGYI